jgi:hypothetical protein
MSGFPVPAFSIILLILLLALAGLAGAVILALLRHCAQTTSSACGNCGYEVRGLPTFICPECGCDLREVGIHAPGMRRSVGALPRVVVWTLLLPLPAFIVTLTILVLLPDVRSEMQQVTLVPASLAHPGISIGTFGSGLGRAVRPRRITLAPSGGGGAAPLEIALPELRYSYIDPARGRTRRGAPLDADVLQEWMLAAGIASGDTTEAEAIELMSVLKTATTTGRFQSQSGPEFTLRGGSTRAWIDKPAGTRPVLAALWLVVWMLGIYYLARRRPTAGEALQSNSIASP